MANQFRPRGRSFNHSLAFDSISLFTLCTPSSLFLITPRHLRAIFHFKSSWTCSSRVGFVSSLQPGVRYLPMKRSGDWPMLQRRNEPSPTSIPCAITYSIKSVVSSLVIVMNMQGANFFVSRPRKKETLWG